MRNAFGITYTGKVRGQFHSDEHAILFFTGMTKEELYDLKYDMGKRWLTVLFGHFGISEEAAVDWYSEKEIMQVWNLNWRNIDTNWIVPFMHKITPAERMDTYRDMHCAVFTQGSEPYRHLTMSIFRTMERINRNLKNEYKKMIPDFTYKKELCHE